MPQWNCNAPISRGVREGRIASPCRTQASIAVSLDGERWLLLNASPDLRQQFNEQRCLWPRGGQLRHSPVHAVLLTGGEIDNVAGLLTMRERQPFSLWATSQVLALLDANPIFEALKGAVRAKLNIVISGGTGAGKTTLLNVLSGFIGDKERIVTIEDAAELQLHQDHVARLETRPPNVEGKGAIRQRQLVINALRMRPDRIVVGEVRGEEALDMLQAMNTGHDGSLTTVHANTPRDALSRIETMIATGAMNLPERAMRQQIASAIQIVVQQTRLSDGSRKVTSISEITGMEGDIITMQEIFLFEKVGITQDGKVIGRFRATGVRPKCCERLRASGIHLPADMFEGVTEVR